MKTALKRKLQSQRGASLLLALLFLALCSLVSATILMAAVSNAGKARSNLREHQSYLALSSAVDLICDEIVRSEYRGKYNYKEKEVVEEMSVKDPETGEETIETTTYYYFTQLEGSCAYKEADTESQLTGLLKNDLDTLFARQIESTLDRDKFATLTLQRGGIFTHTWKVHPQTGTALDEKEVEVQLKVVEESYAIELTAQLDGYQLQAELTPSTNRPSLPGTLSQGDNKTEPLQWKVGWITTGEEEE
ncbi:hypothetical protein DW094_08065 [Ruminococcaceae bacterium AM07-15]|nr:hypothetical protein DW094_08065 [Ruminococcaceae bacterium AM07-15]